MDEEKCEIKHCQHFGNVTWYRHSVCDNHFGKHCEGKFDLHEYFQTCYWRRKKDIEKESEK